MAPLTPAIIVFVLGVLITATLIVRGTKGALLIGMLLTTAVAATLGRVWGGSAPLVNWKGIFAAPDFSLLFALDLVHSLTWSLVPVIFAFVFTGMFDGLSTFVALAEAANLMDDNGEPRNIKRSLETDATSTLLAALFGSSPGTAYI